MKGVNKIFLLGNVGKDPEIRSTTGGTVVANLSLATPDREKVNGEWQDHTEWHNLVAFGKTAEVLRDYVQKGSQLHVEGKVRTRSWEDRSSGEKKYRTEIVVDSVTLIGSRPDPNTKERVDRIRGVEPNHHGVDITDDDIPF